MIAAGLFNITAADWAALLTGAASFGGFLFVVIKWLIARSQRETIEKMDTRYFSMVREYLKDAAARAGPKNTRIVDVTFVGPPQNPLRFPVILDTWLTILPGCDILGDQFSTDFTNYYLRVSNTARIRRHTHVGKESVFVVKGRMTDLIKGIVYTPGETWVIHPGEVHAALFEAPEDGHGMFLVSVEPPLPDSSQATILLDGIHSLTP